VQSSALKDAFEDLEWPGSSIQIALNPEPPVVTFRGEGHGDLEVSMAARKSQVHAHFMLGFCI
jgi:cell cycle checkpoint protein